MRDFVIAYLLYKFRWIIFIFLFCIIAYEILKYHWKDVLLFGGAMVVGVAICFFIDYLRGEGVFKRDTFKEDKSSGTSMKKDQP
jgi:energy-coupling factor transporter transmembrane protein EcfT